MLMYQCRQQCTTLVGNTDNEESKVYLGAAGISLCLPQCRCELKTALKDSLLKKKKTCHILLRNKVFN